MIEWYLHSVRVLMDCPAKERERLLTRLGSAITAYMEDCPEADEKDLLYHFGKPADCAARLSEECPPEIVAAERQRRVKRRRIVVGALAALLVVASGIVLYFWANGGLVIIDRYH